MPITSSDIKIYAGDSGIPENSGDPCGGAMSTATRLIFGDAALANAPAASGGDGTFSCNSTNNADNGVTVTVYGRNPAGSLINEAETLGNSGVAVDGASVFERIMKVTAEAHNYDIEIKDSAGNEILTMESGVTTVIRPFYNISSDVSSAKTYYSKCFVYNNHGSLSLLSAYVNESADPLNKLTFALGSAFDDSEVVANRTTAPTGTGAGGFSSASKTLLANAGSADLGAGTGIACWLKLDLDAGDSPQKSTYTLSINGETI